MPNIRFDGKPGPFTCGRPRTVSLRARCKTTAEVCLRLPGDLPCRFAKSGGRQVCQRVEPPGGDVSFSVVIRCDDPDTYWTWIYAHIADAEGKDSHRRKDKIICS